jgi:hypothetical protein
MFSVSDEGRPVMTAMEKRRNVTFEELERLVTAFEATELTRDDWTHEAHLFVGLWYAAHYPRPEAISRMRRGIRGLNRACGVADTTTSGYHETITLFYMNMLGKFVAEHGADRPVNEIAERLMASDYAERTFPLKYYSKERLFSVPARMAWMEPDRREL